MSEPRKFWLTIDRCPAHDFYAVCLDTETGGTRLTPSKCCGRWERVKAWALTEKMADEIIREFENAKEELSP